MTITDANGCSAQGNIELMAPPPLNLTVGHLNDFNGFDIDCAGNANGGLQAVFDGGTGTLSANWSSGQSTANITNLTPGDYTVVVTDVNNCSIQATELVVEPLPLAITLTIDQSVSCHSGSDAQLTANAAGGVVAYEYSLDESSWQGSPVFPNLSAGNPTIYLRDANGCTANASENLAEPPPITIVFQNIVDAQCNDPVGSAEALASGGNGGLQYQWFDENNNSLNAGATLVNATAGVYRVEVLDVKNCIASDFVGISSIGGADFEFENVVGVTCAGDADGTASVKISAGEEPFAYQWSNGQTTATSVNMVAGNYFATVTDGEGCRTVKIVHVPTPPALKIDATILQPACTGDCNGTISVVGSGGTGQLSYLWADGKTSPSLSNLCAGSYGVTLTDARGCNLIQEVVLNDPPPLAISLSNLETSCYGNCDGAVTSMVTGGTGPLSYEWNTGQHDASLSSVCPGDYSLVIRDVNGCESIAAVTIPEKIPLTTSLPADATLCVGQTVDLDIGGGWQSVQWTASNGYASTSSNVVLSEPGDYFIRAIQNTGCVALDTFRLATSLDLLKAEFLVPAEMVVGDTLVAIDVSWPLPDQVEWTVPSSFVNLNHPAPDILFAVAAKEGTYNLGMRSFLAQCQDYEEKQLTVVKRGNDNKNGRLGYEALIVSLAIYPNPTDGEFDVYVELREEASIQLKVIQYPAGRLEASFVSQASQEHLVHFDLPDLAPGVHYLLLEVKDGKEMIRFMKK